MTNMRLISLIIFIALGAQAGPDLVFGSSSCGPQKYKIPETIGPIHYDLLLEPDASTMTTKGSVDIRLEIITSHGQNLRSFVEMDPLSSNQIVLNADRQFVKINEATMSYTDEGGNRLNATSLCYDETFGNIVVTLSEELKAGTIGTLHLDFTGKINTRFGGIFKDNSYGADGKPNNLLMTQLEASDARKMFPCFDEPEFKATFQLSVVHNSNETALSNTAVLSSELYSTESLKNITRFVKTPKMSSYLVAIVIGKFDYIEQRALNDSVLVRVYTPVGRVESGRKSLEAACKFLNYFRNYLGIDYPLDKLDFVSSPNLPAAGMENFGLITAQDEALLFDDDSSLGYQQIGIITIAHEVLHHWIGNLVTLRWWNEMWLNEGIVTWLGYHVADKIYPELEIELERKTGTIFTGLSQDIEEVLRPAQIESEADVEKLAQSKIYIKSCSVAEMVHEYVGSEAFKKAIADLVSTNMYSNSRVDDLIRLMEKHSGLPVADFVNSWLDSEGHPILHVDYDSKRRSLVVDQARYSVNVSSKGIWTIPLQILVSGGLDKQEMIDVFVKKPKIEVDLPNWYDIKNPNHFIMINPNSVTFMHALYSDELLKQLTNSIGKNRLTVIGEVSLIKTAGQLLKSRLVSAEYFTSQLRYTVNEKPNPIVLNAIRDATADNSLLDSVAISLIAYFEVNGFREPEAYKGVLHRLASAQILSVLANSGHEPVIKAALTLFDRGIDNVPLSLRTLTYNSVVKYGTFEQVEKLVNHAKSTHSYQEKKRAYESMFRGRLIGYKRMLLTALENDSVEFSQKVFFMDLIRKYIDIYHKPRSF